MKKFLLALYTITCLVIFEVRAQEGGKFYEDVLISTDIKTEKKSSDAKDQASQLLDRKPATIKIEGEPLEFRSRRNQASNPIAKPIDTTTKYGEAPFGLSWGATYNQALALGVEMKKVERQGMTNSFVVTKLPKPISDFQDVYISFGDDNKLWRIMSYSTPQDDDEKATKAVRLYRKYYKLLNIKYGNAKESFSPKITVIEKKYKDMYGKDKVDITRIEEPIGGANFLSELQNKEATLFATFENGDVGSALTINVNDDDESYIIIDYTNLRIFKEREDQALNAL